MTLNVGGDGLGNIQGIWGGELISPSYGGTGVNNGIKTIMVGGNFITSGTSDLTLTTVGTTNVILPTTGVLVNNSVATLSNLSSIGTITTGTWNGNTVGVIYGGTGLTSTTANQLLYSSGTNTIAGLPTSNNGVLVTNGSGVPSISSTLPSAVQNNITSMGTITTGVWNGSPVTVPFGGTGLSTTTAYGVICGGTTSTGNLQNIGAGTAAQTLMSNGAGALPTWGNRASALMYFYDNVTTTAATATPSKVQGTTILANNVNFDTNGGISNRLRYTGTNTVNIHVTYTVNYTLGNTSNTISFYVYKNGILFTPSKADMRAADTTAFTDNQVSMSTIVSMATNDHIEIFVSTITSRTMTPSYMTVAVMQCN